MKAQAVNIDWIVGLSVFLVAVVAATVNVVESADVSLGTGLESKAVELADSVQSDASTDVSKTPLFVRQPHDVGRIPVDRNVTLEDGGSAYLSTTSKVMKDDNRIVAAVSSGNTSHSLTSFSGNITKSFESNISAGETLENNQLSLNPENGGFSSLRFNGEQFLESSVDLGESGESTRTHGVYGSAYNRLKVYTGTREIVIENPDTNFHFRNFSTLHSSDGSELSLTGEQVFMDRETQGFALSGLRGTDLSASFVGDMDARVYQDGEDGTKLDINSSRLRLMLHSDEESSVQRVENKVSGDIYFGAEQELTGVTESGLEEIESGTRRSFERKYSLTDYGYNISGAVERGSDIPLQEVSVNSRPLPKVYWNGTVEWTNLRVAVWQ